MKRLVLALSLVALFAAGCGGSSGGGSDEDQIRDLTSRASGYIADSEYANYCDLLSPDALREMENQEGFEGTDCEGLIVLAQGFISDKDLELMANPESIEIDGDKAVIVYGGDLDPANAEKIDGEWMIGADGENAENVDSGDPSDS